jgi:outer membrane biosynthesis protein TonB
MSALFILLSLLCSTIAFLLVADARTRIKTLEASTEALKRELAKLIRERATAAAEPTAVAESVAPPPAPVLPTQPVDVVVPPLPVKTTIPIPEPEPKPEPIINKPPVVPPVPKPQPSTLTTFN